jgi:hypothetical protein
MIFSENRYPLFRIMLSFRLSMTVSENRYPPRYQSCGAGFFLDHALDAERAAQPIATPESVSLVVALNRGAVLSFA